MRISILTIFVFIVSYCTYDSVQYHLEGQNIGLTIIHTSDIHSRLIPYSMEPLATDQRLGLLPENQPFGGISRLAYLLKRERAKNERTIHLDSGDCFQGAPIFNVFSGEAEFATLSQLRPDAVALGNHEFDAGAKNLVHQYMNFGNFPLLAANYIFTDPDDASKPNLADIVKPYTILNQKGLRIAVIGLGNISSINSLGEGNNSMGITPLEANDVVQDLVNFLSPQVDLIGVTSHMGLSARGESFGEDTELVTGYEKILPKSEIKPGWKILEERENNLAKVKVPGVVGLDFIMGGHLHVVLNPPKVLIDEAGRPVILAHSGAFLKYLGRLDLVVHIPSAKEIADGKAPYGAEIVSHKYELFPIDKRLSIDPEMSQLMLPYEIELNQKIDLNKTFAITTDLVRRFGMNGEDSPLGNLVADAMRYRKRVEAQFSMTNSLGIRTDMQKGPVTIEQMFNIFPFENTLTTLYLSGEEVIDLLDYVTARSAGRGCQTQAQVSGITFVMNCAQSLRNENAPYCDNKTDCIDSAWYAESCLKSFNCKDSKDCICESQLSCQQNQCYIHPAQEIRIDGKGIIRNSSYKLATNDYIAAGGSGFRVLKRNTTQFNTGISLRDALIDYMELNKNEHGPGKACTNEIKDQNPELFHSEREVYCIDPKDITAGRIIRKVL